MRTEVPFFYGMLLACIISLPIWAVLVAFGVWVVH